MTFNQLPKQIRKHYLGGLEMTPSNSTMFLKETQAVLQYVPAELKDLVNSKLKGKALRAALRAILSKY